MRIPVQTRLLWFYIIAASAADAAILQEWTFDQPDGTQLIALTNSGTPGDAAWVADATGVAVLGGALRATDTAAGVFVNTTDVYNDVATGVHELAWVITSADLTTPDGAATWGLSVRDGVTDLLTVRLQYSTAASELRMQATDGGVYQTIYDFNAETMASMSVRVMFDLDADTYDVFLNDNGAGETLVADDYALSIAGGKIDFLRLGGATQNIGSGNHIDIDNVRLSKTRDYYVANSGSDAAPGTLAAPFLTIQHAFDKAGPGDTIYARGGVYRETVILNGKSGSAGLPITLTAYNGEEVVISGLDVVPLEWSPSGIPGVFVASYNGPGFQQLFMNTKPMLEGRWPNVPTDNNGDWDFFTESQWAAVNASGNSYGTIKDADLAATGWDVTGSRVVLNVDHQFYCWTRTVSSHSSGSDTFTYPTDLGSSVSAIPADDFNDDRFYLVGELMFLDAPGEWIFDSSSNLLYFYPPDGLNPNTQIVEFKRRGFGIKADGNSNYIKIDGITFWGTAFQFGDNQNNRSTHVLFCNNQVLYSSWTEYLSMPAGDPNASQQEMYPIIHADDSQVLNNMFAYGALSGLFINGFDNLIENNVFHDFDLSSSLSFPPLLVGRNWLAYEGKGGRATIRYNTLFNSGGILMHVGLLENEVYMNNLYSAFRACWGGNKDVAALYTQRNQTGTRFHHNWVHDGIAGAYPAFFNGGLGIRGDDDTSGLTVHHNVTWNLGSAGIVIKNVEFPTPAQANICVHNTVFNEGANNLTLHSIILSTRNNDENSESSLINNMAEQIYGWWNGTAIGALAAFSNNSTGTVSSSQLESIEWFDFRPLSSAVGIIDGGTVFAGLTGTVIGSAPDIGAYERGDSVYWIPGRRESKASFPIVPNGAFAPVDRDVLMWRPALGATAHHVYFGTSLSAIQTASPASIEFQGTLMGEDNVFSLPSLASEQWYYWRVDAIMADSSVVQGEVWRFSTAMPEAYYSWSSKFDLDVSGGKTDDPDLDGLCNLGEFGLGGDPTNPGDRGRAPEFVSSGYNFDYTHARLADPGSGLDYVLELSEDLSQGSWFTTGYSLVGTTTPVDGFEFVTYRIDMTDNSGRFFVRLRIESTAP